MVGVGGNNWIHAFVGWRVKKRDAVSGQRDFV